MKKTIFVSFLLLISNAAQAVQLSSLEPRSLAMGGTGVASASVNNASVYNPALLAVYPKTEDLSTQSRMVFPQFGVRFAKPVADLSETLTDDLALELEGAINDFNLQPNEQNALVVADRADQTLVVADSISNQTLGGDAIGGFEIAIAGKRQGGSFFVRSRAVAFAYAEITGEDREILQDYVDGLIFVGTSGQAGVAHPELFNNNGDLINRTDEFNSQGSARGLVLVETGMALAREVYVLGTPWQIGVTPKFQSFRIFDVVEDGAGNGENFASDEIRKMALNFDVGVAMRTDSRWRFGAMLSNLRSIYLQSELGTKIGLEPRLRTGLQYEGQWALIAADLDITRNKELGIGKGSQFFAVGVEKKTWRFLTLRGGYRHDLRQFSQLGGISVGAGLSIWDFIIDLAYATGERDVAASLEVSVAF